MFKDKVFLITGGTGSFGNVMINKLLKTDVGEIRIFSRDEKKQTDMRENFHNPRLKFFIGDVRDYNSVDFAMTGVNFVFHAAALKQVPSCEFHPMEAVKTNIIGTENVLNSSIAKNVERVVVLSTDKAVYPINAMGISKSMLEKLMVAKSRTYDPSTILFCGTRYGNVLASRGSVIPFFIERMKNGQDLTVTDPKMTRFLLPLEVAIELVIFAFQNAEQGDIFVRKAPACTIGDLTIALKEMFKADNPVKVIGTRHGEKLHETLVTREEMTRAEDMGDYFRISPDSRDLNYDIYFSKGKEEISKQYDYTSENTQRLDIDGIIELLMKVDYVTRALRGV